MTLWDHRVLTFGLNGVHSLSDMEAILVDKGGDGWEVATAVGENPTRIILKRPKPAAPAPDAQPARKRR